MLRIRTPSAILYFLFFLANCLLPTANCFSQPKLVVGIVVDQMRYDYIEKYWNKFGNDGFKRLVNEGFSCKNTNYNYVPTFTGPGHASIYTGVTPSVNGIVGNEWIDTATKKRVYCVADITARSIGNNSPAGRMSPKNLFSSTITDELMKATNRRSKVIAISLKDRGAILPAGHSPTGVYWNDASSGNWITSTYYTSGKDRDSTSPVDELMGWVFDFNKKEMAKKYLSQTWTTLLPIETYKESDADDNLCEEPFRGKEKPVFPYDLPALMKVNGGLGLIRSTPFGNSFTKDFSIEAIRNENMGKYSITDMLCISFSSTDYIGHQFGPQSVEVEDCYLRLDRDIAELLKFIDEWIGKDNALVFLTSDHGASESVPCLQKKNIPSGVIHENILADSLKKFFSRTYQDTFLLGITNFNIYLNRKNIQQKKLDVEEVRKKTAQYLLKVNGMADAVSASEIQKETFLSKKVSQKDSIRMKVKAGFYPGRSGDVIYVLKSGWLQEFDRGTSHGSPYEYDTHVPLIFYGWKVKKGETTDKINITDIAPTISSLLGIPKPSGCIGALIRNLTE